jgi:hypothetical protein
MVVVDADDEDSPDDLVAVTGGATTGNENAAKIADVDGAGPMLTTTGDVAVSVTVRVTVAMTAGTADTVTGAEATTIDETAADARTSSGDEVDAVLTTVGTTDAETGAATEAAAETTTGAAVDTTTADAVAAVVATETSGGGAPNAAGISARGRGLMSASRRLVVMGAGMDVGAGRCRTVASFSNGMATAELLGSKLTWRQGTSGDFLPFLDAGSLA